MKEEIEDKRKMLSVQGTASERLGSLTNNKRTKDPDD